LVQTVVEQVKASFNYYHAHIYLLDETGNMLKMVGGTGKAGQIMLKQNHQIEVGKGLVGRAAKNNRTILVPDVATDPDWLPNPLLPDTQAEIAVPIALVDQVVGVLDVQHNVLHSLSEQDANLLQAVANQVAIALRNAREYQAAQNRARQQALLNEISQKIQTTNNMEAALQTAVRELGQAVGASQARARLHRIQATNGKNDTTEG
jgi:GAF domain-containing protein